MTGLGTAALPEGGRVDFRTLRDDRRQRLVRAMAAAGVDVLVLGRPANVAYASGARQLWTSGTRPFAPACAFVAADRRIHLLSTWDEGVPADVAHDDLWSLSWNPAIAAANLRAIPALATAHRIGSDGTSVSFERLVADVAPGAELVDAGPVLRAARGTKTPEERIAIETACAIAEAGLEAMRAHLTAGVTERQLLARHVRCVGALGAPIVPDEAVALAARDGVARAVGDRPLEDRELVALAPSASYVGYEASLARTFAVGTNPAPEQVELGRRCRCALDAVVGACRPGATGAALWSAWREAGGGDLDVPLAVGTGLGAEPPVVGLGVGDDVALADDMVLVVQGWLADDHHGGWFERDVVAVGDVPQLLTRWH